MKTDYLCEPLGDLRLVEWDMRLNSDETEHGLAIVVNTSTGSILEPCLLILSAKDNRNSRSCPVQRIILFYCC